MINLGELVLVRYPFTSGAGAKQRPGVVLLDAGDADIVVARITSQLVQTPFDLAISDWRQGGLLLPSIIRLHKPFTIEKNLIIRPLGRLTPADIAYLRAALRQIWTTR